MKNKHSLKIQFFILIVFFSTNLYSQEQTFNEQIFFKKIEQSYYALGATNINNFTVLLTNFRTETFAKENWKNSEIFPLQLIWLASDKMFLAEQGVPSLNDSTKNIFTPLVSDLKKQVTGTLFDLKRFYFNGIDKSISQEYSLRKIGDMVQVQFISAVESDTTYYTYYFGENGLCLKIISETPSTKVKIETYPHFRIVKTKWLITAWEVQMSRNNKIETGFTVSLKSKMFKEFWVPSEMHIAVQQSKTPGATYSDIIKFRNFLFNQPLQYIQPAN